MVPNDIRDEVNTIDGHMDEALASSVNLFRDTSA